MNEYIWGKQNVSGLVILCFPLSLWEACGGGRRKCIMANYNYSFTFFVCFCFGLLILFVDFVILLYLILICHSYCFRLFVSFPFGWCINSVSGIVFLFSGCVFFLFSLLAYRFGSCVSVLGLRLSVFLFCFYRPQYKLNRIQWHLNQTTEDNLLDREFPEQILLKSFTR